jgi:WD40 repeat protein
VTGDAGGGLQVWNLQSWRADLSLAGVFPSNAPISWVAAICRDVLVVRGRQSTLKVFRLSPESGSCVERGELPADVLQPHEGFCSGDVLENLLAVPSGRSDVVVVAVDKSDCKLEVAARLAGEDDGCLVTSLKFLRVGGSDAVTMLLAGYESGHLLLWDWANVRVVARLDVSPLVPLALDFDPVTSCGVAAGNEDFIVSFTLDKSNLMLTTLGKRTMPSKGVSHLKIRNPIVVAGGWDSTVKLFSWKHPEKLKPLGALRFHSETVEAVECSPRPIASKGKGRLIAAASKDKKISFWSVYNDA